MRTESDTTKSIYSASPGTFSLRQLAPVAIIIAEPGISPTEVVICFCFPTTSTFLLFYDAPINPPDNQQMSFQIISEFISVVSGTN